MKIVLNRNGSTLWSGAWSIYQVVQCLLSLSVSVSLLLHTSLSVCMEHLPGSAVLVERDSCLCMYMYIIYTYIYVYNIYVYIHKIYLYIYTHVYIMCAYAYDIFIVIEILLLFMY